MEEIKKPLYPNLEAELKRHGLNNKTYGEKIGVSPSGVSSRLNGKVIFDLKEMIKTKRLLKKSMDYLFDDDFETEKEA